MSIERVIKFGEQSLYETDYALWLKEQHRALRAGDRSNLDFANLAEEIEDLGKNLKREVASRLEVLIQHLIKLSVSLEDRPRAGWKATVREQRRQLDKVFSDSPSLRRYANDIYGDALAAAKADAHAALADHEPGRANEYLEGIMLAGILWRSKVFWTMVGSWKFPGKPDRPDQQTGQANVQV